MKNIKKNYLTLKNINDQKKQNLTQKIYVQLI